MQIVQLEKPWKKIPFDENVEHIEDRIWAHKVINKGYKLIYEPEAAVFHWHGINQNMDEKRCSEIVSILENLDNIYRPRISTNLKNMNTIAIVPQRNISLTHNNKNYLITKTIQDLKNRNIFQMFILQQIIQKIFLQKLVLKFHF